MLSIIMSARPGGEPDLTGTVSRGLRRRGVDARKMNCVLAAQPINKQVKRAIVLFHV